jgi:hypothetical protein
MITEKQQKNEEKEFKKVGKMIKEKDDLGLGKWLKEFSEKGSWWLGEDKVKKNDWL